METRQNTYIQKMISTWIVNNDLGTSQYFQVLPVTTVSERFGSFYVVNQKGNKLSSRDTAIQKPHHYQYILD